jgi:hypothetical protein
MKDNVVHLLCIFSVHNVDNIGVHVDIKLKFVFIEYQFQVLEYHIGIVSVIMWGFVIVLIPSNLSVFIPVYPSSVRVVGCFTG